MKIEKFKVLLYLKRSGLDKSGKAPIMGRITVNRTMAQFSCKLSCTPDLWNPRESRLNGKSREAVEVNAKIDRLLLAVKFLNETAVESIKIPGSYCYQGCSFVVFGDPLGARTQDPILKRDVLYQLS